MCFSLYACACVYKCVHVRAYTCVCVHTSIYECVRVCGFRHKHSIRSDACSGVMTYLECADKQGKREIQEEREWEVGFEIGMGRLVE